MANSMYTEGIDGIGDGSIDLLTDNIRWVLLRSGTYNDSHSTLDQVVTAGATVVASSGNLASKTFNGRTFDAADDTFGTPASGAACNAAVLTKWTGTNSTTRLIMWQDDATNLPVTPNGTDPIPIVHAASGIFTISNS